MALKPLAKLLKKRFKTIKDILEEYEDKKNCLKLTDNEYDKVSIEASFALSYDALSPKLQEYWRRLAVFPADFEKQSASTVFGTEFEEGKKILFQFYDYSLIEEDATSKEKQPRFNLHDLAKEFADKQLSEEERFNAQHRHAFYYTLVLRFAIDIELSDSVNGLVNALKLIDTEWNNITTGQIWSAKFLDTENNIAELCSDYAGLATDILSLRLTPREEIVWYESALKASRKFQNQYNESIFLAGIGKGYLDLGDYEKAFQFFMQSLDIAEAIKNTLGLKQKATVLNNLAKFYGLEDNKHRSNRKSANFSKRALKIYRQLRDIKGICICLSNLGSTFQGYYERFASLKKRIRRTRPRWWYEKSLEYSEQAKSIADEIGNQEISGASRSNIGRIFLVLNIFPEAKKYFEEALEFQMRIRNPFGIATTLANLGCACLGLGKKEKACDLWREALAIFESIESPYANEIRQWIEANCLIEHKQ